MRGRRFDNFYHKFLAACSEELLIFVVQGVPIEIVSFNSVWQIGICKSNIVWRWFWNTEIRFFWHYNQFLWNSYCAPSIGPDVNHPQFHLVFAQFCIIFVWFFLFWASMCHTLLSDAGRRKTLGVPVVIDENNLLSSVGIGLTDLPNIGGFRHHYYCEWQLTTLQMYLLLFLLLFYKFLLHLWEVNCQLIFKRLAKTFKSTTKTKRHVDVIKSAVFSKSLPFL